MGIISCFATVIVVTRFLFFKHGEDSRGKLSFPVLMAFFLDMSVGDIGLAIGQVGLITEMIQTLVKCWAELESNMTSVERALEYTVLKQEEKINEKKEKWPKGGKICLKNVNLSYGTSELLVLKNVSFSCGEKEKIGIVGRTGAGKSSIISILYRLYSYTGSVDIDQLDIKTLALSQLR